MFGKDNKSKFEIIKVCKYCDSGNIIKLKTSGGFGSGDVYTDDIGYDVFLCKNCGRITTSGQFEKRQFPESVKEDLN